ncbi:hypothetical protein Q8G40_29755, partial [Klebsiella pneumoniae]|uniref:hypothetical protein n=1 Tax=Klebsiella pneumoniae TaxID=573 RepID=UPI003013EF99
GGPDAAARGGGDPGADAAAGDEDDWGGHGAILLCWARRFIVSRSLGERETMQRIPLTISPAVCEP